MEIINNANTTTIVSDTVVFDPARDMRVEYGAIPPLWSRTLEEVAPTVTAKIAEQSMAGESWETTLQKILPILAMTAQQREILQIQLERARNGLPPLPNSDFGAQVSVGLDPQTRQILMIGAVALAGLLAWRVFARKG